MIPSQPSFLTQPFAQNGDKNTIPSAGGDLLGLASLNSGFPPITQTPLELGGIPPQRKDFNGILYLLSAFAFYQQSGGIFEYSATANYNTPAVIMYDGEMWYCKKQNGVDSANGVKTPGTDSDYWVKLIDFLIEQLSKPAETPIGTIIMWASSNNPADGGVWLDCDGQSYDTDTYTTLYSILGASTVPNLKGLFPRCVGSQDLSVTINGTTTTETFDGGSVGTKSADAIRNITGHHGIDDRAFGDIGGAFYKGADSGSLGAAGSDTGAVCYFDASKVVPVASENKPASVALRFLIKAK